MSFVIFIICSLIGWVFHFIIKEQLIQRDKLNSFIIEQEKINETIEKTLEVIDSK